MLIERIRSFPQTKLIVTHHLPLVMDLCGRSVLIREGRKIEDLPTAELLENRALLEQFGFDPDFAQWMSGRMKRLKAMINEAMVNGQLNGFLTRNSQLATRRVSTLHDSLLIEN